MKSEKLLEELSNLEVELHQPELRSNRKRLDVLLQMRFHQRTAIDEFVGSAI